MAGILQPFIFLLRGAQGPRLHPALSRPAGIKRTGGARTGQKAKQACCIGLLWTVFALSVANAIKCLQAPIATVLGLGSRMSCCAILCNGQRSLEWWIRRRPLPMCSELSQSLGATPAGFDNMCERLGFGDGPAAVTATSEDAFGANVSAFPASPDLSRLGLVSYKHPSPSGRTSLV